MGKFVGVGACVRVDLPNKPCIDDEASWSLRGRVVCALLYGTNPYPVSPFSEHSEGWALALSSSYH